MFGKSFFTMTTRVAYGGVNGVTDRKITKSALFKRRKIVDKGECKHDGSVSCIDRAPLFRRGAPFFVFFVARRKNCSLYLDYEVPKHHPFARDMWKSFFYSRRLRTGETGKEPRQTSVTGLSFFVTFAI